MYNNKKILLEIINSKLLRKPYPNKCTFIEKLPKTTAATIDLNIDECFKGRRNDKVIDEAFAKLLND